MSLLRMGKETSETPQEVLNKAIAYFGENGVGLKLVEQSPNTVQFTGGGGHVQVMVSPTADGHKTEIDIQTRDWEYDVKRFLQKI